ncbi:MAG: hypothetical protein JSV56_02085 [Methanomassiliicoccales archaeon]|nr:MAG: hypothetical protein JSV56_02085 [Methanomassiliicoccales archaeon]
MRKKILYPLIAFVVVFILHATYSILQGIQISKQWVQIEDITPLSLYFERHDYFLGISYALAGAFTIYAFLKFLEGRRNGVAGVLGGVTLTSILYFSGCFLLGCCGSPMLAVYLGLFGSSFLGFTKPLVLIITSTSVVIGYLWMEKKTRTLKSCCIGDEKYKGVSAVPGKELIEKIQSELQEGMGLAKCRKCGCMKETLENLCPSLPLLQTVGSSDLLKNVESWLRQIEPVKYACLGCDYCFPAVATNIFNQVFPEALETQSLSCGFGAKEQTWPPVPGEYFACCEGSTCPVAVSTLASVELAESLASRRPRELCIVGKTETENIGIDKVIKNTVSNPTIRVLLVAGKDPNGHYSGKTLLALWENGVDKNMRVIGSPGKQAVLRNVIREEINAFRRQVQVVDMIGCEDVEQVIDKVKELSNEVGPVYSCEERGEGISPMQIPTIPLIKAKEPAKVEIDPAGYLVIIPQQAKGVIVVEH